MKIKIVNFGPIKEFEFDLSKKLIVTYGDNNIGKSYAMQVVYLLFKKIIDVSTSGRTINLFSYIKGTRLDKDKELGYLAELFENKADENRLFKEIESVVFRNITNDVMYDFEDSCYNTFGNFDEILKKNPHVYVSTDEFCMDFDLKEEKINGSITGLKILISYDGSIWGDNKLEFDIDMSSTGGNIRQQIDAKLAQVQTHIIFTILNQVGQVYFMPASRTGIYSGMSAFGSIVAELSKRRSNITSRIELPGISEPISDYFISLSSISNNDKFDKDIDSVIRACCDKIEGSILLGQVTFDSRKNSLMYAPNNMDVQFTMAEVSSMVSEVSPIVAFLKYIIVKNQSLSSESRGILFIEEPEAHLHPSNQIKLMEILTELTNAGITLVMSSHSNYVFNKLNNLVLSGKLDYHIYQPIYLEKGAEGSISKPMHIDECGADDENFIDVSEALYNEREQIIQEHNEGTE
ncbi:MAG: AAA family ATPase [Lachnospiraceae bacterium]